MQYEEVERLNAGHRHISRHRIMPPYSTAFDTLYLPKGNIRCGQGQTLKRYFFVLRVLTFMCYGQDKKKDFLQDV